MKKLFTIVALLMLMLCASTARAEITMGFWDNGDGSVTANGTIWPPIFLEWAENGIWAVVTTDQANGNLYSGVIQIAGSPVTGGTQWSAWGVRIPASCGFAPGDSCYVRIIWYHWNWTYTEMGSIQKQW